VENPLVESFNSRVRAGLRAGESFSCLAQAKVLVEDHRQDYNRSRAHRGLEMMTQRRSRRLGTADQAARASADPDDCYAIARLAARATLTLQEPLNHLLHSRSTDEPGQVTASMVRRPTL
jgi:Integrase core domain